MSASRLYKSLDLISRAYFIIRKPLHWSPLSQLMIRPKPYQILLWKTFLYFGFFGILLIYLILLAWKIVTKDPGFMKHEQLTLKLIAACFYFYEFQLMFNLHTALRLFEGELRNGFNSGKSQESKLGKRIHNPCKNILVFKCIGWGIYTLAGFSIYATFVLTVTTLSNNLDPLYEIFVFFFSEPKPNFYASITFFSFRLLLLQLQFLWFGELFALCAIYALIAVILGTYIVLSLQNITIKNRNYNVIFEYIKLSTNLKIFTSGVEIIASSNLCFSMSCMLTLVYVTFRLTNVLHPFLILFLRVTLFYFTATLYVAMYTAAGMHYNSGKLLLHWKCRYMRNRVLRKRLNACKPVTATIGVFMGYSYRNIDMEFVAVCFAAFVEYSANILIATK